MDGLRTAWRWLIRGTAGLGLLFLVVTLTPVDYWWATAFAGPWNDPKGDVLIVLTGSMLDDEILGLSSYWRGVYAFRAFKDDRFREVIITGGGDGPTPIAKPMREFVAALGVPVGAIRLETASRSTHESAQKVAEMLKQNPARYQGKKLVLLTSDYHMYRSYRMFQRAGVNVEPRPIPDARKRYNQIFDRWGIFVELVRESSKIGYYWVKGWI